jgi:hypothetical protein
MARIVQLLTHQRASREVIAARFGYTPRELDAALHYLFKSKTITIVARTDGGDRTLFCLVTRKETDE